MHCSSCDIDICPDLDAEQLIFLVLLRISSQNTNAKDRTEGTTREV